MGDKQFTLMCMPANLGQPHTDSSRIEKCFECGTEVWVSIESMTQAGGNYRAACIVCAAKIMQEEDSEIRAPSEATIQTVMKHTGKTREEIVKGMNEFPGLKGKVK